MKAAALDAFRPEGDALEPEPGVAALEPKPVVDLTPECMRTSKLFLYLRRVCGCTAVNPKVQASQARASDFYHSKPFQLLVATLIMGNFVVNVVEKQIDPFGRLHGDVFQALDRFFTITFAIELLLNIYAHWFSRFWLSTWNLFDLVVVVVGFLTMADVLDGPAAQLKLLRAFRVFRLFKRVKALNKILQALLRALPGVTNAFLVVLLVMSMYAILGVEIFGEVAVNQNGTLEMINGELADLTTAREMQYGDEYFGNFMRALYTLFQAGTPRSAAAP